MVAPPELLCMFLIRVSDLFSTTTSSHPRLYLCTSVGGIALKFDPSVVVTEL